MPRAAASALSASAVIARYPTLDDATVFAAARTDPQGFLRTYRSPDWTVIDEVERVPELLNAVKQEVAMSRH